LGEEGFVGLRGSSSGLESVFFEKAEEDVVSTGLDSSEEVVGCGSERLNICLGVKAVNE